jgi:F-type H+-transporting ATPase subunit b
MRKILVLFILMSLLMTGLAFASSEAETLAGDAADAPKHSPMGTHYEAFWTLISFVALVVVLWKFAWKPLISSLTARQEHIEKQIADAEEVRKEADAVLDDYKAKLAVADTEGKGIIAAHMKRAELQSKELVDKTRVELGELRDHLKAEIDRERREAKSQLWDQAGEMVIQLGSEILGKTMTANDNLKLIDQALVRLKAEEDLENA